MSQKRKFSPADAIKELEGVYSKAVFEKTINYYMVSNGAKEAKEIWVERFFIDMEKTAEGVINHYLLETGLKDLGYVCEVKCDRDTPCSFYFKCWRPRISFGAM